MNSNVLPHSPDCRWEPVLGKNHQTSAVRNHQTSTKSRPEYGCYEECKTVMQSSARWGKTHATAGIHVRLCEKAPSRFSSGKPSAYRPQVCLWKIFWELSHKAFSHGSLPGHVFYLTYLRPASLFIPFFTMQNYIFSCTVFQRDHDGLNKFCIAFDHVGKKCV